MRKKPKTMAIKNAIHGFARHADAASPEHPRPGHDPLVSARRSALFIRVSVQALSMTRIKTPKAPACDAPAVMDPLLPFPMPAVLKGRDAFLDAGRVSVNGLPAPPPLCGAGWAMTPDAHARRLFFRVL
jgi:hypothetical protein